MRPFSHLPIEVVVTLVLYQWPIMTLMIAHYKINVLVTTDAYS